MAQLVMRDAVQAALAAFPADACFVCANGYISREAFNLDDRPGQFYMLGSMGLGPSIALGAALARPERTVVVLDGDGNLLMGLGVLALIGAVRPANLFHLCLDNGVYASTGNQPTVAREACLEGMAREAGYLRALRAETADELAAGLRALREGPGPAFLRVLVEPEDHPRDFARVSHACPEIRDRFRAALAGEASA